MYLVWGTSAYLYITCHYALMSRQDLVFMTNKASFLVCKTSFLVFGVTFLVCKASLGELCRVQAELVRGLVRGSAPGKRQGIPFAQQK